MTTCSVIVGCSLIDLQPTSSSPCRGNSQEWQALLLSKVEDVAALGPLEADRSFIHEELNVLWAGAACHMGRVSVLRWWWAVKQSSSPHTDYAGHEIVASGTDRVLDWFEGQLKPNSSETGRR